jgi:hypothetical protein
MKWLKNLWNKVRNVEEETVRARTEEGKFVADDKSTPNVNEAYTTVKVKKKKRGRPKKKK